MMDQNEERSAPATGGAHHAAQRRPALRRARRTLVLAAGAAAIALLAVSCGGGKAKKTVTPVGPVSTPTASANVGLKTPLSFSPGTTLTDQDLALRGTGQPGRGDFTGDRLIIPSINVNAPFTDKVVPGNGHMPNPISWDDVVYYDFSNFAGLGGLPGKGGNVVLAGHVDYIHHGPAVFWDLRELKAGDQVQVKMKDGSLISYAVVFNKVVGEDQGDFSKIVGATADESMTLITCTGDFNNGHYNQRQIVWAKRVQV